ncbi:MAG: bifunctional DNA primase/polymerase, partial [Gammaproteobacteria bacterium]
MNHTDEQSGSLPVRGERKRRRSKFLKNELRFIERGIPVFPIIKNEKAPLTKNGFKDATTELRQIKRWARRFPAANYGIPTGSASGFLVIDLDRKGGVDGVKGFEDLCHRLDIKIPKTYKIRTPSGGQHLFFVTKHAGLIRNSTGKLGPGIDV